MLGVILWCGSSCHFLLSNCPAEEEAAGCFSLIVMRMSVACVSSSRCRWYMNPGHIHMIYEPNVMLDVRLKDDSDVKL